MSISNSRRLLLPSAPATAAASPPELAQPRPGFGSFDMNVVMVLSVLLCALICSLGLNAILKCALRCSTLLATVSGGRGGGALVVHPKGVRRNVLKKFPTVEYSKEGNKLRGIDGECVICLLEFEAGDRVRVLPKCYHGFHVHCIDKWLSSHTSCPKCRNCLTDTCHKVTAGCGQEAAATTAGEAASSSSVDTSAPEEVAVNVVIAPGCGQEAAATTAGEAGSSSSADTSAPEEVGVNVVIAPVEREGLVSNYRESISR